VPSEAGTPYFTIKTKNSVLLSISGVIEIFARRVILEIKSLPTGK
jgi:hypothetical protein